MSRKKWLGYCLAGILLCLAFQPVLVSNFCIPTAIARSDPQEGWALILEMNEFPNGWTDLPTGYAETQKWITVLSASGWALDHILVIHQELYRSVVEEALDFLISNADETDIALFYISTHGYWMSDVIEWDEWFLDSWIRVSSEHKLLIVSSCFAGNFTDAVSTDPEPHISIGAVQGDELSWAGLPDEGLPVIGCVMNHFLTTSLLDPAADSNSNGEISVEEAFSKAYPLIRNYYEEVVYPAYPDAGEPTGGEAPHPVIDDDYNGEFSLLLGAPNTRPSPLPWFIIPILVIIISIIVATSFLIYYRHKKIA